jgi:hypothetical protein
MLYWIYDIPSTSLALGLIALFVAIYWGGAVVVRPILRQFVRSTPACNDVIGYVLSCFCVFYGLLLGLIAVTAYQNFSLAEANVTHEAAALAALYEDVGQYPWPWGQNLRWALRDYTRYVIKYAWPLQRRGIVPVEGTTRAQAFKEQLLAFQPGNPGEEILHAETLRQFNNFLDARQMRLFAVTSSIPAVMWYVVILGALITIVMVWLFDMKFVTHLLLGGLLSAYLGTMIFLIAAMDNPFRGEVSITPKVFETLYAHMVEE